MRKTFYVAIVLLSCISCMDKKEEDNSLKLQNLPEVENPSEPLLETKLRKQTSQLDKNDQTSGGQVALKFINDYVINCNKEDYQIETAEWVNANPLASKEFKLAVTRMIEDAYKLEPDYGLGFDPIFDAQDYPSDGFVLDSFDANSNYLTVKAVTIDDFKITMKIIKVGSDWLVDGCGVVNIENSKQAKR